MKSTPLSEDRRHLLVFDSGDEVVSTLVDYARRNNIFAASFQAIGALREITFAYWNAETKKYEHLIIGEQVEVIALTGNIAAGEDDKPRVHAHIVVGRRDGTTAGGHLLKGWVHPTLEVFLIQYAGTLQRRTEPETQLPLLAL